MEARMGGSLIGWVEGEGVGGREQASRSGSRKCKDMWAIKERR